MLKGLWIEQSGLFFLSGTVKHSFGLRAYMQWMEVLHETTAYDKNQWYYSSPSRCKRQGRPVPNQPFTFQTNTQTTGWWVENGEDQTINMHRLQLMAKAPLVFPVAGPTE